ncbi:hypothetical protein J6590_026672 [Homalodisca vitripennis]|nr:hypothetical protein J6590_026672 [Homalodisca vitripennis]
MSECASTSSLGSNSSSKAPGANRHSFCQQPQHEAIQQEILRKQLQAIDSDPLLDVLEKNQQKQRLLVALNMTNHHSLNNHSNLIPLSPHFSFNPCETLCESVVGNALEDLHLDEPLGLVASIDRDFETDSPTVSNSISAGLASSENRDHIRDVLSEGGKFQLDVPFDGQSEVEEQIWQQPFSVLNLLLKFAEPSSKLTHYSLIVPQLSVDGR